MLKNSQHSYGWITITMHWLQATTILFMFGLGLYMVDLTYYDPWYRGSLQLHKSIGILLMVLWIIMIVWKNLNPRLKPEPAPKHELLAAKAMHWALYLTILSLLITGYLISTADGRSIAVFDLFEVPALPKLIENQESVIGDIHEILAFTLMGFVGLHFLAALKHHFINKDRTLRRLIKPQV
ncbi:cytochrome b [Parendozoicomonas sp. Alg238-R29]|uniref:cytochrome b n=1 Tax=Parendozoicomonas sp. Alg238-R29 TaxID=2993446 RepID=UPI00248DBFFF|nr:cytochrome b [Parendozoicomonas sp. Alg238-R29]